MAPSRDIVLRSDSQAARIDPEQTLKASKALLAHMSKLTKEKAANANKKSLLNASDDEDTTLSETPVWLTLTTKRHILDKTRLKPAKIVLPHPLNTDPEMSICIISADPQRAYKNIVASEQFPEEWRKRVNRVIDVTKLKAKFKQYEAQRKLYSEHDIFLGDDRIINRLPGILGKTFYKSTAKRPIPINLQARVPKTAGKKVKPAKDADTVNACTPAEMAEEIEKAVSSALVNLSPSTNTAIKVGYAGWSAQDLVDNVNAVATTLVDKFVPQKWQNVRAIYIKGPETVAMPIWLTDELWLESNKDIVADGSEEAKALMSSEKANVGKKRKSLDGAVQEAEPAPKKAKKTKGAKVPESNDDKLDKEIAERKEKLKKQKAAAKKALDV